jgi:hypothetical protein
MPSLSLIPRSRGLSRNIPLDTNVAQPWSPERAGFACAGAQPPSAVGLLESQRSYFRFPDHPITRFPDHPISRSPDFRNVPRSYHTSITRQSNLKFTHRPWRLSSNRSRTARERRSGVIPRCRPLTYRTEASFYQNDGIWGWVRVWVWVLPIANCQLPISKCLPLANC